MKFSNYYLAPASRIVAGFFGCLAWLLSALFLGWKIGFLVGAAVALLASVIVPWRVYRANLPYEAVRNTLSQPLLLEQRVRFTVKDGTAVGAMFLTSESIVLFTLSGGEHRAEFSKKDIHRIEAEAPNSLLMYLNETQCVRILTPYSNEILQVLRQNGWA